MVIGLLLAVGSADAAEKLAIATVYPGNMTENEVYPAMITPPYGMTLADRCPHRRLLLRPDNQGGPAFFVAEVVSLGIITYVPWFVLVLPRALGFA